MRKPTASKRCALYLRVSTGPQVDGNSLSTQKSQLLTYARSRGYQVADVYTDAGLSGKDMNRPELQRMLQDAERRCFDIVLVWKLDRISRSLKDLLGIIATLRDCGVDFAAVDQDFDTSDPLGLLALRVLGGFAQFEREQLVERVKEAHLRRVRTRDWSCGPPPYGYRKENGRLVEVAEEAAAVRRIFGRYLVLKSLRGAAMQLNDDGVRTRKGNAWTGSGIKRILQNPVYAGANAYGRHSKGDTRLKPQSEWTVVPGAREPMVAPEAFRAVQEALEVGRNSRNNPVQNSGYLLSGLVRCGLCGGPMCGSARQKSGKVYRYYRCNRSQHRGEDYCLGMSVGGGELEAATIAALNFAG